MSDDLNDSLDEIFGGAPRTLPQGERMERIRKLATTEHVEKCHACHGTGVFRGTGGRVIGDCFKCKGKGERTFKQSATARADNRAKAAVRASAKADTRWQEFVEASPAEAAWLVANQTFEFAASLKSSVEKFGDLTHGQRAAVHRGIERAAERKAKWAERKAAAPAVDAEKLTQAFARARAAAAADGERLAWQTLQLDTFKFSDAPANDKWPAAIFVKEGETKLGKITGGKFFPSRDCDSATEARVLAVLADPVAAARAFGQRTKQCSCCGRTLTNKASREAGIGPICAERFGF